MKTASFPQSLSEFVAPVALKSKIHASIAAAQTRGNVLDHILLYGPPGLGKTTLANVIANEMGARIHLITARSLERPRDIVGLVHQLEAGDILYIDEIHRLSHIAEEHICVAMEDFSIDLTSGHGHATRTMRLPLPRFTLIGATTKNDVVSDQLRQRFRFFWQLEA